MPNFGMTLEKEEQNKSNFILWKKKEKKRKRYSLTFVLFSFVPVCECGCKGGRGSGCGIPSFRMGEWNQCVGNKTRYTEIVSSHR